MKTDKSKAVLMLKTCRGQIDAILKMIDDGRYCMDIANQILAAEALLKKSNRLILKQHMEHCVKSAVNSDDVEVKMKEIIEVMDKLLK